MKAASTVSDVDGNEREGKGRTMTNSEMIMSSGGGLTFMYRVGGIAVHDGCLLVEHNEAHGFCFVPGGRVEYGENAVKALARELYEELGEEVKVGRLLLAADNLFEVGSERFQEITLYFLIELAPESRVLERDGAFEGGELGTVFQWIPLDDVEQSNLVPPFLWALVRDLPASPEYIAHVEAAILKRPNHATVKTDHPAG